MIRTAIAAVVLHCIILAVSPGAAQVVTLVREDFENADFTGYSTLQNAFAIIGSDYFERGDNSLFTFDQDVTGYSGSNFIGLEDMDGAGLADPHWLELDPIDVSGYKNLSVNLLVAAPNSLPTRYESNDFLRVEFDMDGGGYTIVGQFFGTGTGGSFQHDTNLDGIGDVPINQAMQR